jgi:hypothetical protein
VHTKPASLIAGCRHYATFGIMPHSYRLAFQFWLVSLLYSRKELIHIHMNYLPIDILFLGANLRKNE